MQKREKTWKLTTTQGALVKIGGCRDIPTLENSGWRAWEEALSKRGLRDKEENQGTRGGEGEHEREEFLMVCGLIYIYMTITKMPLGQHKVNLQIGAKW